MNMRLALTVSTLAIALAAPGLAQASLALRQADPVAEAILAGARAAANR